jgi:hypothetical protein
VKEAGDGLSAIGYRLLAREDDAFYKNTPGVTLMGSKLFYNALRRVAIAGGMSRWWPRRGVWRLIG